MSEGWIGVDLDGTLAVWEPGQDIGTIGAPIPAMVERVRHWLAEAREVRIVTARVATTCKETAGGLDDATFAALQEYMIYKWCRLHLGRILPVTATKDFEMIELWDDRAVQVETNTGRIIGRHLCR
jgi:hypothetical protein